MRAFIDKLILGGVNMLKKSMIALGMSLVMVSSNVIPVMAAGERPMLLSDRIVTPNYVNINRASSTLTISGSTATVRASVQKTASGENIYLSCSLQKYLNGSWTNIKSWSDSSSTAASVYISEKYSVSKGKYRVKAYYSVNGSGKTESNTIYSKVVTY